MKAPQSSIENKTILSCNENLGLTYEIDQNMTGTSMDDYFSSDTRKGRSRTFSQVKGLKKGEDGNYRRKVKVLTIKWREEEKTRWVGSGELIDRG